MSDINGQESIAVGFYNSLLGVGSGRSSEGESSYQPSGDTRQVRMSSVPSNYSTVNRLIDETDNRVGRRADQEENLSGLTKRLAEMFEQKQELVAELKNERIKSETFESERDSLQRQLDRMSVDYDQALARVEQSKAVRKRAVQFMEEAREATRRVITESRTKVTDSEDARAEAERAYEDEHNLRRNLEQLLQEMRAESDSMTDKITVLSGELRDMRLAKDEADRKLAENEQSMETLQAENEAHKSRIDHLTSRNELISRNLQSINMEHSELRKQFEATAVSHAALSADYESLMRRCADAEAERDQLRIESIEHANFSAGEVESLKEELARARNVIILLRPIIQKAGIGDLRKGDIRLLDERLTDYENVAPHAGEEPIGTTPDAKATYQPSTQPQQAYQPAQANAGYAPVGADGRSEGATVPSTTADLYEAFEMAIGDLDEGNAKEPEQEIESVSFVDMFGKPQGGEGSEEDDLSDYDFDTFDDFDEFDDLDEPDELGSYRTAQGNDSPAQYDFDISDAYDDSYDKGVSAEDFAFPQDLKRSETQMSQTEDSFEDTDDDDFELDNLSDFNSIMADFAHYTAENFME